MTAASPVAGSWTTWLIVNVAGSKKLANSGRKAGSACAASTRVQACTSGASDKSGLVTKVTGSGYGTPRSWRKGCLGNRLASKRTPLHRQASWQLRSDAWLAAQDVRSSAAGGGSGARQSMKYAQAPFPLGRGPINRVRRAPRSTLPRYARGHGRRRASPAGAVRDRKRAAPRSVPHGRRRSSRLLHRAAWPARPR